jgi:hypothetical protein
MIAAGFGAGVGMASTPMRRAMTLGGWMGIFPSLDGLLLVLRTILCNSAW